MAYEYLGQSSALSIQIGRGLQIAPDGYAAYVSDRDLTLILRYNLSTQWDISTASYGNNYDCNQSTAIRSFCFNDDGTRMYIDGTAPTSSVWQYTLSTPYDITTATYENISFSIADQDATPIGILWRPDGYAFYICGFITHYIYQYNTTTQWDITGASYSGNSLNITLESSLHSMVFINNGTRMAVIGTAQRTVYFYDLSSAYDITTAVYSTENIPIGGYDTGTTALAISPDDENLYIYGDTNKVIYQFFEEQSPFITGSGSFDLTAANIEGEGTVFITGAGAFDLTSSTVIGEGSLTNIGTGSIELTSAEISSTSLLITSGTSLINLLGSSIVGAGTATPAGPTTATPLSISDRIDEIMDSFYTSFPATVKYYIGQRQKSVNRAINYIVFMPVSEALIAPHIQSAVYNGYAYDFCMDRNITFNAEIQAKSIETLSTMIYGLTSAIKLTNGPKVNININWNTQEENTGITRQGELATVSFDLLFPVPTLKSLLVTPELFEFPVDFVEILPSSDGYVINPNLEIAPYYATGEMEVL